MDKVNNSISQNDLGEKIGNEIMKTAEHVYRNSFRDAVSYYGMFKK